MAHRGLLVVPGVVAFDAQRPAARVVSDYGVFFLYEGEYPLLPESLSWYTTCEEGTLDECKAYVADEALYAIAHGQEFGGVIISSLD